MQLTVAEIKKISSGMVETPAEMTPRATPGKMYELLPKQVLKVKIKGIKLIKLITLSRIVFLAIELNRWEW